MILCFIGSFWFIGALPCGAFTALLTWLSCIRITALTLILILSKWRRRFISCITMLSQRIWFRTSVLSISKKITQPKMFYRFNLIIQMEWGLEICEQTCRFIKLLPFFKKLRMKILWQIAWGKCNGLHISAISELKQSRIWMFSFEIRNMRHFKNISYFWTETIEKLNVFFSNICFWSREYKKRFSGKTVFYENNLEIPKS